MSATIWAIITNPLNIWRRLRKLRRELRETQRRVAALEDENAEIIKALYGLRDILKDINGVNRLVGNRLKELERIVDERTGD